MICETILSVSTLIYYLKTDKHGVVSLDDAEVVEGYHIRRQYITLRDRRKSIDAASFHNAYDIPPAACP